MPEACICHTRVMVMPHVCVSVMSDVTHVNAKARCMSNVQASGSLCAVICVTCHSMHVRTRVKSNVTRVCVHDVMKFVCAMRKVMCVTCVKVEARYMASTLYGK